MSNEFKLVPGMWHSISAINDTNRYESSFLLHCPDLICSDFNPSGVVEGHWCDDEGWQAAVWCGYHDEFHTKFVTPTLVMTIPNIAAPQPPALGDDLEDALRDMASSACEMALSNGVDGHVFLMLARGVRQRVCAAQQAEIERLKFNLETEKLIFEQQEDVIDQLKARNAELEARSVKADALLEELGCPLDEVSDLYQSVLDNDKRYRALRSVMSVEDFPAVAPGWHIPEEEHSRRIDDMCDELLALNVSKGSNNEAGSEPRIYPISEAGMKLIDEAIGKDGMPS